MIEPKALSEEAKREIGLMMVSKPMINLIDSVKAQLLLKRLEIGQIIADRADWVLSGNNVSMEPSLRIPLGKVHEMQCFLGVLNEITETGDLIQPIT